MFTTNYPLSDDSIDRVRLSNPVSRLKSEYGSAGPVSTYFILFFLSIKLH